MSSDLRAAPLPPAPTSREVVQVARGAGFLAGGKIFSGAVRIVMAVLLARWLGADDYGLYVLAVSAGFASSGIASLGLDTAMERNVAVHVRRSDPAALRGSLQVGIVFTIITSLAVAVALFVFTDTIADKVFDEPRLAELLELSAVLTPLLALNTLLLASLLGFKRMGAATLADDFVQPLIRLALIGALAVVGMTAFRASVAITVSYVASTVVMVHVVRRLVAAESDGQRSSRRDVGQILWFAFPFWFAGLLRIVRTRLQPLLLGILGSAANVGVFSVVTSAGTLSRIANLSINKALRPSLAQLHDLGDREEIGRLYATTTRWTFTANLPVFLIMVTMPHELLGLFGPNFETGVSALIVVAVAEVVNAATGMCGAIIAMSEYNKLKLFNSFAWMIVSVAANIALIPPFGVMGAAVAILVSTAAINLIRMIELWVLMRIQPWDRHFLKPVAAALVAALAAGIALQLLPDRLGILVLGLVSAGICVVFFGTLKLLGFQADDQLVIDRVLAMVPHRRARR